MSQISSLSEPTPWESSLCFTGHRPEKLPQGAVLTALTRTLCYYIDHAIQLGFTYFYTGLADGIDYMAAAYLFRLREQNPSLKVIGVQPCSDYPALYRDMGYDTEHLECMLRHADSVHVMPYKRYEKCIFQKRNCYMVEHASGIIAVCSDRHSGSMQTLRYAQKQGLACCHIFPEAQYPYPGPGEWPVELDGF